MSSDLHRAVDRERRAEAARATLHHREAARHGGACWSGLAPEPFRRRSSGELNTAAEAAVAALQAWRSSSVGRLNAALCRTQALARAIHAAATAAQAAMARNGESPCPLDDLCHQARALLSAAEDARAAAR